MVVGFVDSGLGPESSLFADVPGLGSEPHGFRGECTTATAGPPTTATARSSAPAGGWPASAGRPAQLLRSLSPLDDIGHGTQVASIAAGNSDVSVQVNGRALGNYGGVAPRARIAPYKACWAAPDPADDGCATADLVSAIDRATADGVDVLNVSVAGPSTSTPSSAPCSVPPRRTSSWSAPPATRSRRPTPPTRRRG